MLTFADLLSHEQPQLTPEDQFAASNLLHLFNHKIAKSQATGKDGIRITKFEDQLLENVRLIERKIATGDYRFTPYKERLILRGSQRPPRQICIPTVRDRLVLRALCQVLHTHVPRSLSVSPHSLVNQVIADLRSSSAERSFVRVDVKDFFPSIRHDILRRELDKRFPQPFVPDLCLRAVTAKIGANDEQNSTGVPQGLSVSGALSSIYMLTFDERQSRRRESYFRYVDDILIISDAGSAEADLQSLRRSLASLGLRIHPLGTSGKTEISDTENGIDFLGYRITRGCVSVRDSSFKRMFKNVLKVITDYSYRRDVERTKFQLNLKITGCIVDAKRRGWMMFFSRTEDKRQLAHLDSFVAKQLKRVEFPDAARAEIKTFIKCFHEIRFNLNQTKYIPNFDEFNEAQKIEVVSAMSGRSIEEIMAQDVSSIEAKFSRFISAEVHDLEHDVGGIS